MFAPSYFVPSYFAPRYYPPGADEVKVDLPKGGIKPGRKWKLEEDLPYSTTVEEIELKSDRRILQEYLDSLPKVETVPQEKVEKSDRHVLQEYLDNLPELEIVPSEKVENPITLSVIDSGYEERKNKRRRMNEDILLIMLIEEML